MFLSSCTPQLGLKINSKEMMSNYSINNGFVIIEKFMNNCLKYLAHHIIGFSLKHKFPSIIYKYVRIIQQLTQHIPSLKLFIHFVG